MKVACVVATRNRHERAAAVIESARALSSEKHDLRFIVCADDDDQGTIDYFSSRDVKLAIAPAPDVLGEVWNRGAKLVADADVICPLPDDSFIAAPDWDDMIVHYFEQYPPGLRVIGWNDTANPDVCTMPIVGREWYAAAGLFPGWFPYWFCDTWLAEVFSFVAGHLPALPKELLLVARKGKTQRMRDLEFWWEFFRRTRPQRLKEAEWLRHRFGRVLDPNRLAHVTAYWNARDTHFMKIIPQMELAMAEALEQPPSERYLRAKAAAQKHLASLAA